MTQAASAEAPARPKLGIRTGSSRKLLERKAREQAEGASAGDTVEDSFPAAAAGNEAVAATVASPTVAEAAVAVDALPAAGDAVQEAAADAPPALAVAPAPALPPAAPAWSTEDESAFQTLAARRKAAGYQRRGRDVSEQRVTLGAVKPNPGTIVAVIVALVADRGGSVGRADLVAAMADADFPHGKARPEDRGWCQGYVAGAVRNGFLALAEVDAALADAA